MCRSTRLPLVVRCLIALGLGLALLPVAAAQAGVSCNVYSPQYARNGATATSYIGCSDSANPSAAWSYDVSVDPQHGQIPTRGGSSEGASFGYVPNTASGSDSYTVHATENGSAVSQDVTIVHLLEAAGANEAPQCDTDSTTAGSRQASTGQTEVYTGCLDPEHDPLTFSISNGPSHGTATTTSTTQPFPYSYITYTPTSGYTGTDQFDYIASDDHGASSTPARTRYLQVSPPPPPTCQAASASTRPGRSVTVYPNCSSWTAETLSYQVVTQPSHGSVTPAPGGFGLTYTPAADYSGSDSFTYRAVGSSTGPGAPATVTLTVSSTVNQAPSCFPSSPSARAGTEIDVSLFCYDADGDPITYAVKAGGSPTLGTLSGTAESDDYGYGHIIYNAPGSPGTDHVTFVAADGHGGTADLAVTIDVGAGGNRTPGCFFGTTVSSSATIGGTDSEIPIFCTDPDGDSLTYTVGTPPSHGTVKSGSGFSSPVVYTPNANASPGSDSFTVVVSDGNGGSVTVTVNETLYNPDKPSCDAPDPVSVRPGAGFYITAACSAMHWANVTHRITSQPTKGTLLKQPDGSYLYTAGSTPGADQVTLVTTNGTVDSDPVTQSITISASAESAPRCETGALPSYGATVVKVARNGSYRTWFSCTDDEGDAISLSPSASHGTATATATENYVDPDTGARYVYGRLIYTPTTGYGGSDTLTLAGSDGTLPIWDGTSDPAGPPTAPLSVVDPSEIPAPGCYPNDTSRFRAGEARKLELYCFSSSGGAMSLTHDTPTHGTLTSFTQDSLDDGRFTATYTGAPGYIGWSSFHYQVTEAGQTFSPRTQLVRTVSPTANRAPVCTDFTLEVQAGHGAAAAPTLLCSDADGDRMALVLVDAPAKGMVTGPDEDGDYAYVANASASGSDSLTYKATDGHGGTSNVASGTITIEADQPKTVSRTAQAGDTVGTQPPNTLPTPSIPVIASVKTPSGGTVTVTERAASTTAPSGTSLLGREFLIEAPAATVDQPLKLAFSVDASILPSGLDRTNLQMFRDGTSIADCQNPTVGGTTALTATDDDAFARATPDPCVARRQTLGNGDVRLVVLSSHASTWNFGAGTTPSNPGGGAGGGGGGGAANNSGGTPAFVADSGGKPSGGGSPAKDTTAPALALKVKAGKLKTVLAKGLAVTPGCSERCTAKVSILIAGKLAKKLHLSKKSVPTVVASGSGSGTTVIAKFTAKARKALAKSKSLVLTIRVRAADGAGNASKMVSKSLTIRR